MYPASWNASSLFSKILKSPSQLSSTRRNPKPLAAEEVQPLLRGRAAFVLWALVLLSRTRFPRILGMVGLRLR
jgi:hypothetical protein